jgi:hypothetical protein
MVISRIDEEQEVTQFDDDDVYDDAHDDEIHNLVSLSGARLKHPLELERRLDNPNNHQRGTKNRYCRGLAVASVLLAMTVMAVVPPSNKDTKISHNKEKNNKNVDLPITYSCPVKVETLSEYDARDYGEVAETMIFNMTEYIQRFPKEEYDNWGYTYNELKEAIRPFKSKYYPTYLANDKKSLSIYESACGVGLNLFMTLEILEEAGIHDVTVYGNEYLDISTKRANALFDSHATPGNSHKGIICHGDSTKLEKFVPADSMDLVFTGYIAYVWPTNGSVLSTIRTGNIGG